MAERKTTANAASVKEFLNGVKNDTRRKDSQVVASLMGKVSGKRARMWGPSIVGFDTHHYKLANGEEQEICKIGFSPRIQALTFYLANFNGRAKLLEKLGKHKMGPGGCMYINKLADVDLKVLETIIDKAYKHKSKTIN
ncbi:MAG: DUF1801 domain-containing protein [Proteobacteria bacterium]|nr:DUF1801 domain-containing protein [Pseudomonadota bacterium]